MNLKKILCVFPSVLVLSVIFIINISAQEKRLRIVPVQQPVISQNNYQLVKRPTISLPTTQQTRPTLTNDIVVVGANKNQLALVKKTSLSQPINPVPNYSVNNARLSYSTNFNQNLLGAIQNKIGIPYRYGSEGPNSYDCSAFVWKVFQESGIFFERSSAKALWSQSEPVPDDERYQFGTLVFLNRLGHVGIVADENGFYHASTSKGIMYSKFAGYWEKRIVGFRRIPKNN